MYGCKLLCAPPAGIIKNGTDYANKGRWVDGDLVRFENGYLKPIGGWTYFRNAQLEYATAKTGTVTTTTSSNIITVTTSAVHGAAAGDKISLNGFSSVGGVDQEVILSLIHI